MSQIIFNYCQYKKEKSSFTNYCILYNIQDVTCNTCSELCKAIFLLHPGGCSHAGLNNFILAKKSATYFFLKNYQPQVAAQQLAQPNSEKFMEMQKHLSLSLSLEMYI